MDFLWLYIVAAMIVGGMVLTVIRLRKARFRYRPVLADPPADLSERVQTALAETVGELVPLGFAVEANYSIKSFSPEADLLRLVFVQRSTQTLASLTLSLRDGVPITTKLAFETRLVDGTRYETSNDAVNLPIPDGSKYRRLAITRRLNHIHFIRPADLSAIHASRVKPAGSPPVDWPANMLAFAATHYADSHDLAVRKGYFRIDGDWLRPTWKCLLVVAVGNIFIVRQFLTLRRELATDRALKAWRKDLKAAEAG